MEASIRKRPPRSMARVIVDDAAHVDSLHPAGAIGFVLEPDIQVGKLTIVKISQRDYDAIDVAASLVESLVCQRASQVNANEIPSEYGGGNLLKEIGQFLRLGQGYHSQQDINSSQRVIT